MVLDTAFSSVLRTSFPCLELRELRGVSTSVIYAGKPCERVRSEQEADMFESSRTGGSPISSLITKPGKRVSGILSHQAGNPDVCQHFRIGMKPYDEWKSRPLY